jgi:H+/Cl- antiporter ClcA
MLLVAPLGLGTIAWITRRFFGSSQGSGIPQTIAALDNKQIRDQILSLRIAFGKIMLTLIGLCCGASIGREGPMVQVGATIMHSLGRLVRFSRLQTEKVWFWQVAPQVLQLRSMRRLQVLYSP